MSLNTTSFWCYSCTRLVRVLRQGTVTCPHCDGGFVEEIERETATSPGSDDHRNRFPTAAMFMLGNSRQDSHRSPNLGFRRRRRNASDRSPFNPVIVLRGGAEGEGGEEATERSSFEFFYDDGAGSGLRPLPATVSEFLMGSGFDRLLEQLSQIELNGFGRSDNPPASKIAVESMPTIEIADCHVNSESHCAVCKEAFQLHSEAREMPCKHIYHSECILPWLSMRNSCPVCRHELPTDQNSENSEQSQTGIDEETVGLTIWRLPGGGFAVGRFAGGRRTGDGELPVVYTEMDGGFNTTGAPRRVSWVSRRSRERDGGVAGIGRFFRNFVSYLGRFRSVSSSSSRYAHSGSMSRNRSNSSSVFSRLVPRSSNRGISTEEQNGNGNENGRW